MPVKTKGFVELRKALRKFTPELAKESTKELAAALKPLTAKARGFIPSNDAVPSGWLVANQKGAWAEGKRGFDSGIARRGITYSTAPSKPNRKGFRSIATIYNKSAAGAIYETAGRKSGITGNFTPRLGGQLKGEGQKKTGRAIFRAAYEDQGKTTAAVMKAIENVSNRAAELVNKAGFRNG